jgi:polar amino acid transport system permease protein
VKLVEFAQFAGDFDGDGRTDFVHLGGGRKVSIHRGQTEAARSLGMSGPQAMYYIILPQAMRRILPPLAGQFISLIKDSSLLGMIAIRELTKATREAITISLSPYEFWFTCAILYLVLTFTLSMAVQYMERKMAIQ